MVSGYSVGGISKLFAEKIQNPVNSNGFEKSHPQETEDNKVNTSTGKFNKIKRKKKSMKETPESVEEVDTDETQKVTKVVKSLLQDVNDNWGDTPTGKSIKIKRKKLKIETPESVEEIDTNETQKVTKVGKSLLQDVNDNWGDTPTGKSKKIKRKKVKIETPESFEEREIEVNRDDKVTVKANKIKRKKKQKIETLETLEEIQTFKTTKTEKESVEVKLKNKKRKSADNNDHIKKIRRMNNSEEDIEPSNRNPSSDAEITTSEENFKDDPEKLSRTIFIGNLPSNFSKKQLKSLFSKYGKAQSVRIRNVVPGKPKLSKKVAVITKTFHPERSSINAYVVFKSQEKAYESLELNGFTIEGNTIRVDIASNDKTHDCSRSVFVGNLPFGLEDDELRSFFKECGAIESVRIIRDQKTGAGKGFGYVLFKSTTSIPVALKKHDELIANRNIRVFRAKKVKEKHGNRKNAEQDVASTGMKKLPKKKTKPELRNFEGERSVENIQERDKVQRNIKMSVKNVKNKNKLST